MTYKLIKMSGHEKGRFDCEKYSKLRNSKRHYTSIEHTRIFNSSTDGNVPGISSENVQGEVFEVQTLTQEAINVQFRMFFGLPTCQLDKMTRQLQGNVTTQHSQHYIRTDFGTTSGIVTYQFDMVTGVNPKLTTTNDQPRHRQQQHTKTMTDDLDSQKNPK